MAKKKGLQKTLKEVEAALRGANVKYVGERLSNNTGMQLILGGDLDGSVINCFDSGSITFQGSNPEAIEATKRILN